MEYLWSTPQVLKRRFFRIVTEKLHSASEKPVINQGLRTIDSLKGELPKLLILAVDVYPLD